MDIETKRNAGTAYLTLDGAGLIVTLGSYAAAHTNAAIAGLDTSPLGQILISLLLSDFNLLFLTTTTELVRPELVPGLELSATMLGDVALGHGCLGHRGVKTKRTTTGCISLRNGGGERKGDGGGKEEDEVNSKMWEMGIPAS